MTGIPQKEDSKIINLEKITRKRKPLRLYLWPLSAVVYTRRSLIVGQGSVCQINDWAGLIGGSCLKCRLRNILMLSLSSGGKWAVTDRFWCLLWAQKWGAHIPLSLFLINQWLRLPWMQTRIWKCRAASRLGVASGNEWKALIHQRLTQKERRGSLWKILDSMFGKFQWFPSSSQKALEESRENWDSEKFTETS